MLQKKQRAHLKKALKARMIYKKNRKIQLKNDLKFQDQIENNLIFKDQLENNLVFSNTTNIISQPVIKSKSEIIRKELHIKVDKFQDNQLPNAIYLLNNIVYTKGKNIGELFSPYLQKKALNFLEKGIYKQNSDAIYLIQKIKELETKNNNLTKELKKLKKEIHSLKMKEVKANQAKVLNTSKIRSAIQKAKKITSQNFQKSAKKFFKLNKNEYSSKFMQLATEISNINGNSINSSIACTKKFYEFITNDDSKKWISASTLSRWNKEMAILHLNENQPQSWNCSNYGYGLTADESKRGDKKILVTGISF
ncbi:hypothetical protein F8M41_022194 [Gigaspora margarita]|uniref:Uncharacterized protein n=1 Tax=Gigaspora margarita TaxID=4874 RepID=A0A8H4EI86_GIGMA|nr:hypothetical protein F8M41_022194 [Gigaspora margarita]